METKAIHTHHSRKRCQQRGITQQMIDDTIRYGNVIYKQGLRFYVMIERCLPSFYERRYNERLKNTVVVLSDDDVVLTVYKNANAHSNIKKKSKYLRGKEPMTAELRQRERFRKTTLVPLTSPKWQMLVAA
jgi:hypothetical protein